ncbi:MAG TPA: hypothetical protein VIF09_29455, partial [Polyangiaceae bacterium]
MRPRSPAAYSWILLLATLGGCSAAAKSGTNEAPADAAPSGDDGAAPGADGSPGHADGGEGGSVDGGAVDAGDAAAHEAATPPAPPAAYVTTDDLAQTLAPVPLALG